ncbi:MAG: glycosyltransferase family A protein [Hyphomicrobium sp.]
MSSVDVVITSYQYARFLEMSALSVLKQDFANIRLLIIDNASTDGSQDKARTIAARDSRVTLFLNEQNRGHLDSYNRAVDWASGDYFILLDADDLLAPNSLERAVAFLDENPNVAFAYGCEGRLLGDQLDSGRSDPGTTHWQVTKGGTFIRRTCWDSFCDIGAPAVIRRTSAQKKAGHFRHNLPRTCDFEMYLRLAMIGDVACTNRVQGIRRLHSQQMSSPFNQRPVRDFEEHERAFASFFANEGSKLHDAAQLKSLARNKMGEYAFWYGVWQTIRLQPDAREAFQFSASRRSIHRHFPPIAFLWKRRWIRSLLRGARRLFGRRNKIATLNSSFSIR